MTHKTIRHLLVFVALFAAAAHPGEAAAVRSGATLTAWVASSRGNVVGYDSVNHVYLVVSTYGTLRGRFIDGNGNALGSTFVIQASTNYTHFPRLAFAADADGGAGAFLVGWNESDLAKGMTSVHTRIVSYTKGGATGGDNQVAADNSFWESGVAVAYASASRHFLVAYQQYATYAVHAVVTDITGAAITPPFNVAAAGQTVQFPSATYNPTTDQFLVSYAGWNSSYAYVDARLVQASNGAVIGTAGTRVTAASGTYITDSTYNPSTNQYLVSWFNVSSSTAMYGRLLNADGSIASDIILLSSRWKANDCLSIGYNTVSNTYFMVTCDPSSVQDAGVELTVNATPVDNGFQVTATGGTGGNFYPRLAASTDAPNWLVSTSNAFTSTMYQMIAGSAGAGGTPTTPGPTAPVAPVPKPFMNVDTPGVGATLNGAGFNVGGWAIDYGATSGTGVDVVQVWAYPTTGAAAVFVGTPTYGVSRPDVGAAYGSNFTPSGFNLVGTLPGGTYDLAVFAHSTVSGTFNNVKTIRVTVTGPVSIPRMWVDLPSQNQTISQNISVNGWALDAGSSLGTGVDAIHVWAYPSTGAAPVFIGAATYGTTRADVGAAFGSARYNASGFSLNATIPTGDYTLVVFAHSAVANSFNNAQSLVIHVR